MQEYIEVPDILEVRKVTAYRYLGAYMLHETEARQEDVKEAERRFLSKKAVMDAADWMKKQKEQDGGEYLMSGVTVVEGLLTPDHPLYDGMPEPIPLYHQTYAIQAEVTIYRRGLRAMTPQQFAREFILRKEPWNMGDVFRWFDAPPL